MLMGGLPVYVYRGWIRRRGTRDLEPIETPAPDGVPEPRPLVGVGER